MFNRLNGLHTIWNSGFEKGDDGERNRVAADYAAGVSAGSDRVLELLAERDGVFTVYGDVHNGSIIRNKKLNVYECSFGPIGRTGGRKPLLVLLENLRILMGEMLRLIHFIISSTIALS